jgi:ribosomal-protein-alanine N-acetyltransferase
LPETSKYSLWSPHESLSVTKQFIAYQHSLERRQSCFFFVVEEAASKEIVGSCSYVSFDEFYKIAEIGYSVLKSRWGKGYGTEIADALTAFAFNRIGVQRVFARVVPENVYSAAVLENLGFAFEGTLKKAYYYGEKSYDIAVYGMTDDQFKKRENENGTKENCEFYG